MSKKIEDFGKVVEFEESYEFKITDGFSGKANDTFELMKICSEIAQGYNHVKRLRSKENFFHLVLIKK